MAKKIKKVNKAEKDEQVKSMCPFCGEKTGVSEDGVNFKCTDEDCEGAEGWKKAPAKVAATGKAKKEKAEKPAKAKKEKKEKGPREMKWAVEGKFGGKTIAMQSVKDFVWPFMQKAGAEAKNDFNTYQSMTLIKSGRVKVKAIGEVTLPHKSDGLTIFESGAVHWDGSEEFKEKAEKKDKKEKKEKSVKVVKKGKKSKEDKKSKKLKKSKKVEVEEDDEEED